MQSGTTNRSGVPVAAVAPRPRAQPLVHPTALGPAELLRDVLVGLNGLDVSAWASFRARRPFGGPGGKETGLRPRPELRRDTYSCASSGCRDRIWARDTMPPRPNPELPLEDALIAFRLLSSPDGASVAQVQRALRLPSAELARRVVRQVQRAMGRQPPGPLIREPSRRDGSRRKHQGPPDRPAKGESTRGKPPLHARPSREGESRSGRKDEQDVPPVGEWYAPHRC
jgi:hypothetical protein